jgi:hypothetical protein
MLSFVQEEHADWRIAPSTPNALCFHSLYPHNFTNASLSLPTLPNPDAGQSHPTSELVKKACDRPRPLPRHIRARFPPPFVFLSRCDPYGTAPDRDVFLAPTENVPVPYYRLKASAIAIWWRFPNKLDKAHLIRIYFC